MVRSVIDKHDNGMKIIDSRNINDYNKNSVSYFTCNSINDDIKANVSADIIGVSSCQGKN